MERTVLESPELTLNMIMVGLSAKGAVAYMLVPAVTFLLVAVAWRIVRRS